MKADSPDDTRQQPSTSRAEAIRKMCVQCMGGENTPGLRTQIRGCTGKNCPLYPWRPYRWPGERYPTSKKATLDVVCGGQDQSEGDGCYPDTPEDSDALEGAE